MSKIDEKKINRQADAAGLPWRLVTVVDAKTQAVRAALHPVAFSTEFPHARAALGYVVSRAQQGGALEIAALRALMARNTPAPKP